MARRGTRDAAAGRGDQPRPGLGRGSPRPPRPFSPGQGGSPPPGVAPVVPSRSSLSFALGENVDFNDEVIEAIRNLPESHSDSLEFLCRAMDVENCDSSLGLEEFKLLSKKIDPSSAFEFHLPKVGDRIRTPPSGFFTVYSSFFSSGFTLPPHPLLVDIIKESGLCVSQFTPNSFLYFEGFLYRFRELGLPLSFESFFTLFSVRKIANDSFFFFFPRNGCKFFEGSASSKGPWKEKFFYVKDVNWGFTTSWGEVSPVLSSSHDLHMSFIGAGKKVSLQDIQRYKAKREREQRDRDGRARPPPPASRKNGERRRSPPLIRGLARYPMVKGDPGKIAVWRPLG
ncbi:UNVERIFIED_CONTAM: hypothetical protein Sradi_5240000 [Sesamum radiatum]|uniref:Transposase (putative) gypsy type domain-containing protein n=1 Tax=Sesamum radiatum TaxID=300843 RepID=A0AAW2LKN0_SESRA